ncbi:hypothetical protein [Novosphingobium cyanobacteriorum]|uniref:Uncharacterized protein n=1 Tax=Novosphingobium cyanobacteriorum TaxID=3024215 RepID=A0ABT6CD98_9SPHN|nr:hypothetical protein [Novosphingobium cyanobacteriorum]MDF8331895.1 hypothetical protein [Novosphingobium cyanobacteriorum]
MKAIALLPAIAMGRLAVGSLRTGAEWMRFRQWDAVATHLAIGGVLGSAAMGLFRRSIH